MVGLIGDPPAKAEVYVVTVVSSAVILLRHHGDGVDLHQKLRAREPNGDGGGDRRRVGPAAPRPHERLAGGLGGWQAATGTFPLTTSSRSAPAAASAVRIERSLFIS